MAKKTYAQRKRASYAYREEYFKRNPGLFGCVWFCAYCPSILFGRENVVVDHITPLNNVMGVNKSFNCVSSCQKCNSEKSDTVDSRVLQGYGAKTLHTSIYTLQKIVIIAFVAVWIVLGKAIKLAVSALSIPYKHTNLITKIIATAVYYVAFRFILGKLGLF